MESETTHSKRSVLIGALFGMIALVATIAGVGAIAGAQDDPAPDITVTPGEEVDDAESADESDDADEADHFGEEFEAFGACMSEQLGDLWIDPAEFDFGDLGDIEFGAHFEGFGDIDLSELDLGELDLGDIELGEFGGHFEGFGDIDLGEFDLSELDLGELDFGEFDFGELGEHFESLGDGVVAFGGAFPFDGPFDDETGQQFADANEACRDLLPDDVQAGMAAFDEFNECLLDAGVFEGEITDGTIVHIETPDGFQQVEFGDAEGSVTISGTADGVTVTSTGGVIVLDEAALDAQWEALDDTHEACADLLPDGLFGGLGFGAFGGLEMFDMHDADT